MSDSNIIQKLSKLPQAKSLQQLCDLTYQILGNPVFVTDLAHTILAYTKCVEIDDPSWQYQVIGANLDRKTLKQNRQISVVHNLSTQSLHPVLVEDDDLAYPRIIQTLVNDNKAVGVMVVTAYQCPFENDVKELVELIASFMVPCLVRERYHVSNDNRAVENYFIKLLDGASYTHEQVVKRLEVLNYHSHRYIYVLTMCAGEDAEGEASMQEIERDFSSVLHSRSFLYNNSLVCIYGSEEFISNWGEQVPELQQLLEKWDLIAGVSRSVEGFEYLRESYLQARAILDLGFRLVRHHSFYSFDSLSSFLLFQRIPKGELDLYCHEQIQELDRYDAKHGTELCSTLQVYLEQAKSLAKTADILFIHRNTVRYRINRCMELLGNRLDDGNEIFAFILSLRILEYKRKVLREADPRETYAPEPEK